MSHLAERFEAAVLKLTAEGSVKQRLTRAYSEHLEGLQVKDLPQSVAGRYQDLDAALQRAKPFGNETRARASVRKMSAAEAARHAEAIVSMYGDLLRRPERVEPLKVVEPGSRSVPAYLVGGS